MMQINWSDNKKILQVNFRIVLSRNGARWDCVARPERDSRLIQIPIEPPSQNDQWTDRLKREADFAREILLVLSFRVMCIYKYRLRTNLLVNESVFSLVECSVGTSSGVQCGAEQYSQIRRKLVQCPDQCCYCQGTSEQKTDLRSKSGYGRWDSNCSINR
jgi:hypothetical protein